MVAVLVARTKKYLNNNIDKITSKMENHILIGLGGTGGKVLKAFRKRLWSEYSDEKRSTLPIGFIYVDSTGEMLNPDDTTWKVQGKNAVFTNNEFVNIKGISLNQIFNNPSGYPGLNGFLGNPEIMQTHIGVLGAAAGQNRRAGRLLFGGSIDAYTQALNNKIREVKKISNTYSHKGGTHIHIFTGLAGGTGSGAFIDVIAQTRRLYPELFDWVTHNKGYDLQVYCMIPEDKPNFAGYIGRYHANGYAALTELNALSCERFQPCDVSSNTSGSVVKNQFGGIDGVHIYTNENENGKSFDDIDDLSNIVSDCVYSFVFLEGNKITESFIRAYTMENVKGGNEYEYYEKQTQGVAPKVRSNFFGSFGIKRIIRPEDEIIDYFTYNFGYRALLQLKYNNWSDELGFRDEPSNVDYGDIINKKSEVWKITDDYLMLNKPILKGDKFGTISSYWNSSVPSWATLSEKEKKPMTKLELLCADGYNNLFRQKNKVGGVPNFYKGKLEAKEDLANEIVDLIEMNLIDDLSNGELSLYQLTKLIDKIIDIVNNRKTEFSDKISKYEIDGNRYLNASENTKIQYSNLGPLGTLFQKNKLITRHSDEIKNYYIKLSEIEGLTFGIELLKTLKTKLELLKDTIDQFVSKINSSIEYAKKQANSRLNYKNNDLLDSVLRFYNKTDIDTFVKTIQQDPKIQSGIATKLREEIFKKIATEKKFLKANDEISLNTISQILDDEIREKTISIHDEIYVKKSQKLINRNILEQLSEEYVGDGKLDKFAIDLIEKSGVLIDFEKTEISRQMKNNPDHTVGSNIFIRMILVNFPKTAGLDKSVSDFANNFEVAIKKHTPSDISLLFDSSGNNANEITIMSIVYCFPLRIVKNIKSLLKSKYEELVGNSIEGTKNRILLHAEDLCNDLPSLFVADDKLPSHIREEYTVYLYLNEAMGFVKYADKQDGTGKSAWGTISIDELGDEVLNPLANKFTEIPSSDKYTENFGEELKAMAEKLLKSDYEHIDKRAELVKKIQSTYQNIVVSEFDGNKGKPECIWFANQAKKAMEIINS